MFVARLIFIIIIVVFAVYTLVPVPEGFKTKGDKAAAIYNWFVTEKNRTYERYRNSLDGASNIVEYEDVNKLMAMPNFTVASVENVI